MELPSRKRARHLQTAEAATLWNDPAHPREPPSSLTWSAKERLGCFLPEWSPRQSASTMDASVYSYLSSRIPGFPSAQWSVFGAANQVSTTIVQIDLWPTPFSDCTDYVQKPRSIKIRIKFVFSYFFCVFFCLTIAVSSLSLSKLDTALITQQAITKLKKKILYSGCTRTDFISLTLKKSKILYKYTF